MSWGGLGGWGGGPVGWGGALPPLGGDIVDAVAIAENVVRVYFDALPYYSGILDLFDASDPGHWALEPVAGSVGFDGNPARECGVLSAALGSEPNSIDLTLDRPMTPYPALYVVAQSGLAAGAPGGFSPFPPSSFVLYGVYRELVPADPNALQPSRDFANPQTASDVRTVPGLLGTYPTDDTGDYAVDDGLISYKKRVLRRGITRKNAFAHMPGYGVGIPTYGKQLARAGVRARIAADYEAQIRQEPETDQVKVTSTADPANVGLFYFLISAKMKSGTVTSFAAGPFSTT